MLQAWFAVCVLSVLLAVLAAAEVAAPVCTERSGRIILLTGQALRSTYNSGHINHRAYDSIVSNASGTELARQVPDVLSALGKAHSSAMHLCIDAVLYRPPTAAGSCLHALNAQVTSSRFKADNGNRYITSNFRNA